MPAFIDRFIQDIRFNGFRPKSASLALAIVIKDSRNLGISCDFLTGEAKKFARLKGLLLSNSLNKIRSPCDAMYLWNLTRLQDAVRDAAVRSSYIKGQDELALSTSVGLGGHDCREISDSVDSVKDLGPYASGAPRSSMHANLYQTLRRNYCRGSPRCQFHDSQRSTRFRRLLCSSGSCTAAHLADRSTLHVHSRASRKVCNETARRTRSCSARRL
jgi:hypothetical protein